MDHENIPDPIAALDQLIAGMGTLATLLAAHYREMAAAGFSDEQAFALTLSFQAAVIATQAKQ